MTSIELPLLRSVLRKWSPFALVMPPFSVNQATVSASMTSLQR